MSQLELFPPTTNPMPDGRRLSQMRKRAALMIVAGRVHETDVAWWRRRDAKRDGGQKLDHHETNVGATPATFEEAR
jgi:hypothetical protein